MGIKLSSLGGLKNKNKKEIKAVVFTDNKNNVITEYDDFDFYKDLYGEDLVEVYEPNKEQTQFIIDNICKSAKAKDDKLESELGYKIVFKLLKELTNIDLDLEHDDFEEIISNPNQLLLAVKDELDFICNFHMRRIYNQMLEFKKQPEELQDIILSYVEKQESEKVLSTKEKKRLELQRQLKELEEDDE